MAVTAIWHVSSRVGKALDYIMNPEKTVEKPENSPDAIAARKAVGDVIDYASNADKTERMMYVTGINCTPETALEDFMETKRYWGKTGGRLAYHGYQAFLEGDGEISAETAHEIGVKLAQELWGDRFEVVVATHLNTGHYHSHFVINSVSFMDGYKYVRMNSDYVQMRKVSDRLCKEYNLHVVKDPANKKAKSYAEWRAEKQGKTTVRGSIRDDIDYAISVSRSEKEFAKTMKELGYEFKFFRKDGSLLEHPGLKPPGAQNFFRFRGLGPNYDYDSIQRRIIENTLPHDTPLLLEQDEPTPFYERPDDTVFSSKYRRYCFRLFSYISKPKKRKREYIPYALREDIAKLDRYIEQMDFLYDNKIQDTGALQTKKSDLEKELKSLIIQRRKLYTLKERAERQNDIPALMQAKAELSDIAQKIHDVRNQLSLCEDIEANSLRVEQGLEAPIKKPELEAPDKPITKKNRY